MTAVTDPAVAAPSPGPAAAVARPAPRPSRLRVSAPPPSTRPARRLDVTGPSRVRHVRLGAQRPQEGLEDLPVRPLAPQPAAPLPDPTAQCCSVVRAAVEVLRGDRNAAQLARWVTPQVLDQLVERARLARLQATTSSGGRPVLVRRVRLVRLGDDVAEATVVLDDDGRVRAAAARLEARRGTWRVAVLELG
jgi:hypothetical protein